MPTSAAEGTDVRAPVVVVAVVSSKRSDSESVVAAEAADVPCATVAGEALPCLLPMWERALEPCSDADGRFVPTLFADGDGNSPRASTKYC